MVLMAITSSGSAEMVAVSSVLTYDVYLPFWRKNAKGKQASAPCAWQSCLAALFRKL